MNDMQYSCLCEEPDNQHLKLFTLVETDQTFQLRRLQDSSQEKLRPSPVECT